jgi:hypothetical protein
VALSFSNAFAQQATHIPVGGSVWNFGNVGIFGDMGNDGMLGSSATATVDFMGKRWVNGNGATLPSVGTGGLFRFIGNNILYGPVGQQFLFGGYSVAGKAGTSFPNLEINNIAGILLEDLSDLKIRYNLHFSNGHIFLNGWNLQVGDTDPGSITGYSDQRFVVTGTGIAGGYLYRPQIGGTSGNVVFPVGTAENNYAPAAVQLNGAADDFKVRVFDNVYQYAVTGGVIPDSFVYKTWHISRMQNTSGEANITLQHLDAAESPAFAANRENSFITRFINNAWDYQEKADNKPVPGTLSTGVAMQAATMQTRIIKDGLGTNEYFSKKTNVMSAFPPANFIRFDAYRVTVYFVQLEWSTTKEFNNLHFEVERKLDNEADFTKVATIPTRAPNGNSNILLDYNFKDANSYDGWSYYRIKAVSRSGNYEYTTIRAVPPMVQIEVYPNPNAGQFKVRIHGIRTPMLLQIMDTWGQQIRQQEILGDGEVEIRNMPTGTYFLVMYHKATQVIAYRCKVVVIDH